VVRRGCWAAMLGDYETAERLLNPRRDAVALVHWRTGRFDKARVIRGLPLSRVMTGFHDQPYRIEWHEPEAVLPFVQRTSWELPTVEIEIDGRAVEACIDTGGDTLTLPARLRRRAARRLRRLVGRQLRPRGIGPARAGHRALGAGHDGRVRAAGDRHRPPEPLPAGGVPTAARDCGGLPDPRLDGFLRRYRWTIDFTRMTMRFAPPG
jgi:hypothetical protein